MKLLTHTPTLLAGLFALGLMNIDAAQAAEPLHRYSNSGYCQLAAKGTSPFQRNLLAAYAGKLGYAPSQRECRSLQQQRAVATPVFELGSAIRQFEQGSVRKLPNATVEKLKTLDSNRQQQWFNLVAG
ncbi:MAG: hypothetical protein U5L02_15700 [Rheinheimera sp.]|nr:hypothetical protein [Rheinheimera sp.]